MLSEPALYKSKFVAVFICLLMLSMSSVCQSRSVEESADEKHIHAPITFCPETFNGIDIPLESKSCQVFATEYPASMIFYVPSSPNEVVEKFQKQYSFLTVHKSLWTRTLLQSKDKNTTVIISPDGDGTQIDILVKEAL